MHILRPTSLNLVHNRVDTQILVTYQISYEELIIHYLIHVLIRNYGEAVVTNTNNNYVGTVHRLGYDDKVDLLKYLSREN